jgi:rhamnopyranosyl-N-acetylglucosaminyl-diphospho-decaprenol beta-1,3/1,4-galactofuranosyltransferase
MQRFLTRRRYDPGVSASEGPDDAHTVCAVVVTYNRCDLLARCLDHLRRQSRPADNILVVDNASTDGTAELLVGQSGVEAMRLPQNLGGAGGFERGIERAHTGGYEWIWLLDDDTFADERCLETLLAGVSRAPRVPSVMTSVVRWRDSSLHPMNRPWLRIVPRGRFAEAVGAGLAPIRAATFVSTMVHRDAVAKHGLPPGHYFVWLDDIQYTGRILREGDGYMVPESSALHWTPTAYDTVTDTRERFYLKVRNHLWLLRGPSFRGLDRLGYARSLTSAIAAYLRGSSDRRAAVATVLKGVRDGLRREPA